MQDHSLRFTFQGNYSDSWKKVDSLEQKGLYESALKEVDAIFVHALNEKNTPNVLRAVMYKMKYNSYMEEEDHILAIHSLDKLSGETSFPLKQLLHSVSAEVYWNYYAMNRWRILERTQTVNFNNTDVRTWDLKTLFDKINKEFMQSLMSPDSLKRTDIKDFKEILITTNQSDKQRPTLYDFLAHRALNHFSNTESGLSRPEEKFTISGQNFFGDAHAFLQVSTVSEDTLSNLLYATRILKDLTQFHHEDKDPTAFIDLELKRLEFAQRQSKEESKNIWYEQALSRLSEKYKGNPACGEIRYKLALYHFNQGSGYSTEKPELQWELKKAADICEATINDYPKTYGAEQCRSLLSDIGLKEMNFYTENAYPIGSAGKFLFKFRNMNKVYFRMIKVDWNYFLKYRNFYGNDEQISQLLKLPVIESWNTELGDPGDHQSHSIELKINPKEAGQYVLLSSPDPSFPLSKNAIAFTSFWYSDLSYSSRRNDLDGTCEVFVTDRETGAPLVDVNAQLFLQHYNYNSRNYDLKEEETYRTDKDGMFVIRNKGDYRSIYIDLEKNGQHFNEVNQIYLSKPYKRDDSHVTTTFFTDRAIYRPGQKIYFKGIRIKHNGDKHTIETGKQTTVKLLDVNYQVVSELKLTTNDYGTFSGSFTAPEGVLNGQMRIVDDFGSVYFSVEEYKRPKFEVEFSPVSGVFKIGEKIKLEGNAKSYAGSNVDGAAVQYRVVRSCRIPYWMRYRYGFMPNSGSTEIVNGTVNTDENGKFTVEFTAKEDKALDKKFNPIFTYTVYADVTDITGETRSAEQWVRVGYTAMEVSVDMGGILEKSNGNRFKVKTTNLMGEKIEAKGTVKIIPLIENDRVLRSSLWARPDLPYITEEEFKKLFPYDEFRDESNPEKLKQGEPVFTQNFDTRVNDTIEFRSMKNWKPGRYVLSITSTDAFGETVSAMTYFTLLDKTGTEAPLNEIWSFNPLKTNCEPGQHAEFLISSGAENLQVLYEIEHKGKIVQREFITLNRSQKLISIPVEEKHRGNFNVHFTTVRFGRSFRSTGTINVPYSNKELDLTFETFRDKLLPGQKEEWRIRIKGPQGEKVAAEMLATMYDASLDAFAPNSFLLNIWNSYHSSSYWTTQSFDVTSSRIYYNNWNDHYDYVPRTYDYLNFWGYEGVQYHLEGTYYMYDRSGAVMGDGFANGDVDILEEVTTVSRRAKPSESRKKEMAKQKVLDFKDKDGDNAMGWTGTSDAEKNNGVGDLSTVKARSDMSETAFFMPQLKTNEQGEVIISFTIPESLTRWKFMGLAHTKDLKTGYLQKETVTQKELMVMPNAPRFLREGDKISFTAKVSNLSDGDLNGTAQLILTDALTGTSLNEQFGLNQSQTNFTALKGQSAPLSWEINVPEGVGAVTYKVVAQAKNHTDGEEGTLPVLSNRMLVTESMPLPSRGTGTKEFTFEKLKNSGGSKSIRNHKLTLEYTSNPAWYAVQALPYMMEYPHECAEQIFSRFYANSLASAVVNSNPKIKEVFKSWKESSPEAFLSNLEKNQELKSVMLQETPWVLDASNEQERKKRIALLFELSKMERELDKALNKLEKMQVSNGGWSWFPGMPESRYITQHIVSGMGHLDNLAVRDIRENKRIWNMVVQAVNYLDERILEDYKEIMRIDPDFRTKQHISSDHIQYLYARSFFKDIPMGNDKHEEAVEYFRQQAKEYWKNFNIYSEGMIALQAHRSGDSELSNMVMVSLKERAIEHEELGTYWKDNTVGYYWYQAPIETQALMIEAFDEITSDLRMVEDLKVWLLKQKQTTDWKTTKATAEACYALLLRGTELLTVTEPVEIKMAGKVIDPKERGAKVEAGTGYFKTSWSGEEIKPEMGSITVTRKNEGVSWGAVYWEYFEDLDKITTHETPLKLSKKLFLVVNTESGPVITPISDETALKPGDKVRVRIELRSDRDMEYIHMRDMRASGFEPVNVFSQYKWQDGLGYYESTGDAATNFFMDYLRKGTYVFEYDVRVTHQGDFSNGITTIQCMYAPEFTSHSEGIRVKVD